MPDLTSLLRAGEGALRHLAWFAEEMSRPGDVDEAHEGVDLTIIFADIEGFSELVAEEGDDAASLVLDQLDAVVSTSLERHPTARLIKLLGDGVMLAADDAGEGLALTAQLPVEFAARTSDSFPLRLRAGAHHGRVRPRGQDVIGYHVNVAARVATAAEGGQALVTRALLDAAERSAAAAGQPEDQAVNALPVIVPAGVLEAKGVPERPPLFSVHPPSGPASGQSKSGPAMRRSA